MSGENPSPEDLQQIVRDLERSRSLLRIINDFALRLLGIATQTELVWYVAREVVGRLGFVDCVVYLVDPHKKVLRQAAAIGIENTERDRIINALEIPIGKGITGHVARTREPLTIEDLNKDSRYIPDVEEARSEICVPLIIDDEVVGVIDCEDTRPGHFDDEHLELLTTVAAMTSAKLKMINQTLRAEESTAELRASEERFRDMAANVPGIVYQFKIDAGGKGSFPYVGPIIKGILGIEPADIVGNPDTWFDAIHPDDRPGLDASIAASHETLEPWQWEGRMARASGEFGWFQGSSIPRKLEDGSVLWNGLVLDVSETREAEAAVRTREAWLRTILESVPIEIVLKDTEGRIMAISRNVVEVQGLAPDDVIGGTSADFLPEDIAETYMAADREVLESGRPLQREVVEEVDGSTRHSLSAKYPLRDDAGEIIGVCSITSDITQIKEMQWQLHQAQKMETVGQLTGGVAHDFNNLLTVILGNAELLTERLGGDKSAQAILRAATRGAELTQRLLAFSRRQPLHPRVIDLGGLVNGMTELLQRTLGETIAIETSCAEDLWRAEADPGQVENAVLNLAVNARDAMPGGGKLIIESANASLDDSYTASHMEATPGDYVMLAVSDTGSGMTPEVLDHAFEPFFTTKEVGAGSGLGLSMVYGFAKQSGGEVGIYSEPGHGTTVKLYLPRAAGARASKESAASDEVPRGHGEVVLVIEDDEDVSAMATQMLEDLGYRVIGVPEVASARKVLERGARVDIVLSDVVLPGDMSGPEFAKEAARHYPSLKIVFVSGYPTEAAIRNGFLGSGKQLLNKPFQRSQLAQALRAALA
jgi:PAS domain S-box-containing protein